MDTATVSPYRAPTFRAPHRTTPDDLTEVTVTWGEQVLSVAHLKAGEGFAWEGTPVVVWRDERWVVTTPAGATGWTLRGGEATVTSLREGDERALDADDRAGVVLGEVTVRVARTVASEALPRAKGGMAFAAVVAGMLVLAVTGLAMARAQGEDDDGTIARDDTAERAWLTAHLRPYPKHAPRSDVGQPIVSVAWGGDPCGVFCAQNLVGLWTGTDCWRLWPASQVNVEPPVRRLEDAYARSVHLAAVEVSHREVADSVRRVVLRNLGQLSFCRQEARASAQGGRAAIRFAIGSSGAVLGAGVASATTRPESMTDCFANAFRHWQFRETPRGEVVVATVTLSVR